MQEQIKMQEQEDITAMSNANDSVAEQEPKQESSNENSIENEAKPSTFTQEQVNDIVKKRLEKERAKLWKRYGVEDNNGLDSLITKAKAYEIMDERYAQALSENQEYREKLAFLENNIEPKRYDDIRAYFKGKELDLTGENLINELSNHPEWSKQPTTEAPRTTISLLGSDNTVKTSSPSEKDIASKMFGLDHFIKR